MHYYVAAQIPEPDGTKLGIQVADPTIADSVFIKKQANLLNVLVETIRLQETQSKGKKIL